MVIARFEEIVDLPSFGTELVMSIVFGRGPSYGMKKIEERTLRYDSAKTWRASSGCNKVTRPMVFSFGICPRTFSEKWCWNSPNDAIRSSIRSSSSRMAMPASAPAPRPMSRLFSKPGRTEIGAPAISMIEIWSPLSTLCETLTSLRLFKRRS